MVIRMTHNQLSNVYIASCTGDGGIYQYHMYGDGKLELVEKTALDRPMYMIVDNNKMYIVLRAPFEESQDSGVVVYDIDSDGRLINPSEIQSTCGEVACHIAVDGENIYCANYISGSVIKLPDTIIKHEGSSVHSTRQTSPHAHYVGFTPDKKYLCAVDLGVDTIFIYNKDLTLYSKAEVPKGHGARHIVFSDDGKYMFCANELKSTVSGFSYNDGCLELVDTISVLPKNCGIESTVAAIRFYSNKIYISNRGHNSISEVSIDNKNMKLERCIECKGSSPRDFDFVDDYMICTNEESNDISIFDTKNNFTYIDSCKLDRPLCVLGVKA